MELELREEEYKLITKCLVEVFEGFYVHNPRLGIYHSSDVTLTEDEFKTLVNFIREMNYLPEEIILDVIDHIEEE